MSRGSGTALMKTPPPPSIGVLRMMVAITKVMASVSSANSSPRSRRTRNTTAPMPTRQQRRAARPRPAASSRNGQPNLVVSVGRRVHAGAEEGAVAEAEVAGKAAQEGPAGRQRDPEEHEVEERFVEGRQPRHRQEGQRARWRARRTSLRQVAGGVHSHSGSHSRMAISTENDTSGAQAGLQHRHGDRLADADQHAGQQRAQRVAQPADDDHGEHHAEPGPDLRRRERGDQRDEGAGDAGIGRAHARQQIGELLVVDAEGRGDVGVLGAARSALPT